MNKIEKFIFLTLHDTEIATIRPNSIDLMKNLKKQGFQVVKYVAADRYELKKMALDFAKSKNEFTLLVFSSDEELYEISRSDLTIEEKKSILPVGNELAFEILGSKVGFSEFCLRNSIPHPKTQIIKTQKELQNFEKDLIFPIIIKSDRGAGGHSVFRIENYALLSSFLDAESMTPLILQENIKSKLYSVEAYFWNGHLTGWMFSEIVESVSEFGISFARKYFNPEDRSFIEILNQFGKLAKVTGFASCGFFHSQEYGYLLFEADLRPNAWHFLFDSLGINLNSRFVAKEATTSLHPLYPTNLPQNGLVLRLTRRELLHTLDNRKYIKYFSLSISMVLANSLKKNPGMKLESFHLFHFLRIISLVPIKIIYSFVPRIMRDWAGKRKVTVLIIRKILPK